MKMQQHNVQLYQQIKIICPQISKTKQNKTKQNKLKKDNIPHQHIKMPIINPDKLVD